MQVFTLYFVYRCLVRAKVAAIRSQEREHDDHAKSDLAKVRKYCEMALRHTQQPTPTLIVMHGLSGSGKTWLSTRLMSALPAVRLRSDLERKRMFGLQESADSGSAIAQGIYTEAANDDLHAQLHATAETVLATGHDTILDAAYLTFADRERARQLAARIGCRIVFIETSAAEETMRERIRKRDTAGCDASEGGLAVLEYQSHHAENLTAEERQSTLSVDTDDGVDLVKLLREIRPASSRYGSAEALTDCK
jgi:predicted kinase